MKTNKRLKIIEKNSFEAGNKAFEEYLTKNSLKLLKNSIRAYNASMRSIKYQILYNGQEKK
jgi:hypothetical protein